MSFLGEKHDIIIYKFMKEFKKKNKYNFWSSPLVLVVLLILFVFLAYKVIILIEVEKETDHKKILAQKEIEILWGREKSLNEDIAKMQTEEGIEDTIRGKFQVTKPGEKMITIVDEQDKNDEIKENLRQHNFWEWIKGIFSR